MRANADLIYHLAVSVEWNAARAKGTIYDRSTLGVSLDEQGFIHCSFVDQLQFIADLVYSGRADVVLLTIDVSRLGVEVRVEGVDGGDEHFPHVYGAISLDAVIAATSVPVGRDGCLDIEAALASSW